MNRTLNLFAAGLFLLLPLRMLAGGNPVNGNSSAGAPEINGIGIIGNQSKSDIFVSERFLDQYSIKQLMSRLSDPKFGRDTWTSLPGFKLEQEGLPVRTRDVFARILALKLRDSAFEEVQHSEDASSREKLIRKLLIEANNRQ
jgi:hypothetical protein